MSAHPIVIHSSGLVGDWQDWAGCDLHDDRLRNNDREENALKGAFGGMRWRSVPVYVTDDLDEAFSERVAVCLDKLLFESHKLP